MGRLFSNSKVSFVFISLNADSKIGVFDVIAWAPHVLLLDWSGLVQQFKVPWFGDDEAEVSACDPTLPDSPELLLTFLVLLGCGSGAGPVDSCGV